MNNQIENYSDMKQWIFKDLPNTAVITTKNIIDKFSWIGYVSHDIDDYSWQFLEKSDEKPDVEIAMVVSLQNITELDPDIIELADLPLGWCAWRNNIKSPWHREKTNPL